MWLPLHRSLGLIRPTSESPAGNRRPEANRRRNILRRIFLRQKVVVVWFRCLSNYPLRVFSSQTITNTTCWSQDQHTRRECLHSRLDRSMYLRSTLKNCTAVYSVPYGNEGCMVDALASRSDEGRDMAAISFGEVPNNL